MLISSYHISHQPYWNGRDRHSDHVPYDFRQCDDVHTRFDSIRFHVICTCVINLCSCPQFPKQVQKLLQMCLSHIHTSRTSEGKLSLGTSAEPSQPQTPHSCLPRQSWPGHSPPSSPSAAAHDWTTYQLGKGSMTLYCMSASVSSQSRWH